MSNKFDYYPKRIICLTEETTEMLYLLGEEDRIVGISKFTKRPERARKEKEKVSAFLNAKLDRIIELKPDLVIGFSDIQADIAQALIKEGISVWISNHRSIDEILKFLVQLGTLVGKKEEAISLVASYEKRIDQIRKETKKWKKRPKVYFEEWYDPLISGIEWVSEIVEIAGGEDVFPEFRSKSLAKGRIIKKPKEVVKRNPDIMLASWCGKKFKLKKVLARKKWNTINAIRNNLIHEIDSTIILQPGPASITEGLEIIHAHIKAWRSENTAKRNS